MYHKAFGFGKLSDCIAMLSWRKEAIVIHYIKKNVFFNADLY